MRNPKFNNARGSASSLQFTPPFSFSDMTVSVFPLRADLTQLQRFIDGYLNLDADNVRFEAFLPYVYLQVLDYGKMSIEAANMGWVSQVEVAFCVPLRWMAKKQGEWVFHDWAANCPFIFVDNELSMTTGREVYGWPKVLAHIDPSVSQWVSDPHGCQRVFDIQLPTSSEHGNKRDSSTFLSVHKNPSPNFLDVPLNLSGMLDPLTNMPAMGLNMAKAGMDMYRMFGNMAIDGLKNFNTSSGPMSADMLGELSKLGLQSNWSDTKSWSSTAQKMMAALYPQMSMNTVNLKQFRDASKPSTACYQALTNSKMIFRNLNGGGCLGQQNLAFGQIDGGYRIDISQLSQQPVVEDLGLLVDETRTTEHGDVVSLRPVLPFWLKVDMDYSRGRTITWRSQSSDWLFAGDLRKIINAGPPKEPETQVDDDSTTDVVAEDSQDTSTCEEPKSKARVKAERPDLHSGSNSYNTARGAAVQEISGPFVLPQTTVRVLPLLADEAKLKTFACEYLDVEGHSRFEAWGTYAYLVAYNYTKRISEERSQPLFASREVNFVVPVKQYEWYDDDDYDLNTAEGRAKRDEEKLVSTALVAPFSYVDDASVAISSSEVHGVPTLRSDVGSPPHTWMNTGGPEAGQHLLITSALVLPELGVDAGASHEMLLNVSSDPVLQADDKKGWGHLARKWGAERVRDLKRKYEERGIRSEQISQSDAFRHVRALALEVMTGKLAINNVTLKQFRDAWKPEEACYQALVQGRKTIDQLYEVHEIDEQLNVWIHRYPTQPISDILGLKVKHVDHENNTEVFEAIRPFWFRADITEHLGQTLFERVADTCWTEQETPDQLTGWCSVQSAEISEAVADDAAQIRYFEQKDGRWSESICTMEGVALQEREAWIQDLLQREAKGDITSLQICSRKRARSVMANPSTLNHIDRVHVDDLTGFLESYQKGPESRKVDVSTLGKYLGQVSPATILDSILSRQWGRPEAKRTDSPSADFVVHVESLGPTVDDDIFLRHERNGDFWPLSSDERNDVENKRKGLAWQLWDDVWSLVQQGDKEGYSNEKTPADPDTYMEKAKECLPDWFGPELSKKPSEWTSEEWKSISTGLQMLVDWSHYKVDWNRIIRNLDRWRGIASDMSEQLGINHRPDAAGDWQPPNVADVLEQRLRDIH